MATDDDSATPAGYATGQAIGRGLGTIKRVGDRVEQVGQGVAAATADTVTAPFRRNANTVANLARGVAAGTGLAPGAQPVPYNPAPMQDRVAQQRPEVYGLPRRPTTPVAPPTSTASAVPDFSSVTGSAITRPGAPARGAAATGLVSPAGGAPAPLVPGAPNTFTGFDQVTRPVSVAAPAGSVGAQSFGGALILARPGAAPAQPSPRMAVLGMPLPGVNTSRVAKSDAARDKLIKDIESLSFRNSIGGLNSRGQRGLAADLLRVQGDLSNNQASLAGQAAGQVLDASTRAGIATQGQGAESQRALLGEQGATMRTGMTLESEDERIAAAQAGETFRALNRPQLEVGADNTLVQVMGGQAQAVRDEQGNPVRRPGAQLSPDQVLAAYNDEFEARLKAQPLGAEDPLRVQAELDSGPLGQARARVLAGAANRPRPPAPGTVQDGYRFQGGDPADPANWRPIE